MLKKALSFFWLLALMVEASPAGEISTDICVYGGTSGGAIAAIEAVLAGKTVSFAVFDKNLGGMTSGGLSATDKGNAKSIGGMAREFYQRVGKYYGHDSAEIFNFEPHVARKIFENWLQESGVQPRYDQRLAAVEKDHGRIIKITMEDGTIYRAKMFIDATYEGDLMAKAGVSFTIGREAATVYHESLNGIRETTPAHQFSVKVDPYITPGKPESGLLPLVQSATNGKSGEGDQRVQAYNYRLCFTQNATNKLPLVAPKNYDPLNYELLGRLLDARTAAGDRLTIRAFFNPKTLPNDKVDLNNNGAISTDYIGMSYSYPTDTYATRAKLREDTLAYTQGFVYYLATSPRSPESLRAEIQTWGPCKDEWLETGGYSTELYVREARRMTGDYVMTQQNCAGSRIAEDSICLGSYNMDTHNAQRRVENGFVRNEGDVQSGVPRPYPISYRSIVPRIGECENLLVTFAISASHIGFGSIRMEPVLMMISQSAATAAAQAIDEKVAVQKVNYQRLAMQLTADRQKLFLDKSPKKRDSDLADRFTTTKNPPAADEENSRLLNKPSPDTGDLTFKSSDHSAKPDR